MSNLRLITWNINSIRARMHLLEQLVAETEPDIVCLQETKVDNDKFPSKAVKKLGFEAIEFHGTSAHHGVAIFSKRAVTDVQRNIFCGQDDGRHIAVVIDHGGPLRIDNLYVPAGGDIPDRNENPKFGHKLDFVEEMGDFLARAREAVGRSIAVGDLNIAPYETDVWSHKQLLKVVSHTPIEVEKHEAARTTAGLTDAVRNHIGMDEKLYTWWSYRAKDWRTSNKGRRLDHIWTSPSVTAQITKIIHLDHVRDWEKTSDHIPIVVDIESA